MRATGTRQLGIGRQGRGRVSGKFNLWNDGDRSFFCVAYNVNDLFSGVESAIGLAVKLARLIRVVANERLFSPCCDFLQLWIFFYRHPPALVLGKVPVKHVHLVGRDNVNIAFDKISREHVPGHIKQHPAPLKPRTVFDYHALNCRNIFNLTCLQDLEQRLDSVKDSGMV